MLTASAVSMGNPHCVLFVDDAEKAPVRPDRADDRDPSAVSGARQCRIRANFGQGAHPHAGVGGARRGHYACLRHRGGGRAVAAFRKELADRKVELILDGGSLMLEWREEDGHVLMTGPGVTSFKGERGSGPYMSR